MTKISNIALVAFLAGATRFPDPDSTPEAEVASLCEYDAPVQFVEIQGTYQKDRRYFAGGGELVDGGNWTLDSARLQRFEANMGESTLIKWPNYAARLGYNEQEGLATADEPNGYPANMNLYSSCELNTAMCCFTDDSKGESFATNSDATTDVCRHELHDSPQSNHIKEGWSVFPGGETSTHCVGFTWKDDEDELIGNMMYDISLRTTANKGYLKSVPGSPMCGCVEHMPVIETAACRTATRTGDFTYTFRHSAMVGSDGGYLPYVSASNAATITYSDCGDLKAAYVANQNGEADKIALMDEHLVGAGGCDDDLEAYLNEEQFLHAGQHPTKYVTPNKSKWSELIVGKGVYWMPPELKPADADAQFRSLIEAGCKNEDGSYRLCVVRHVCSSCSVESHRDIYYQRLTDLPPFGTNKTAGEMYIHDLFMNHWVKKTADGVLINDMASGDFALYSTYADALAGDNAWTYCDYGDFDNYGFPRNCGPKEEVWDNWNSYTREDGHANHHGFYVELPPTTA